MVLGPILKEQQSNVRMAEPSTSKCDPNEASNISAEKCGPDEADVKSSLAKLVCVTNYNSKVSRPYLYKSLSIINSVLKLYISECYL